MKKTLFVMLAAFVSTSVFAQSAATTDKALASESPADAVFEMSDDNIEGQARSVDSGIYYAKPEGMMFRTFFSASGTHYSQSEYYVPCFDDFMYLNKSTRPLRTHWNLKYSIDQEGTNLDPDGDGNYTQSILPGESLPVLYLYSNSDNTDYYNMGYSSSYIHYVYGSGYHDGLSWMGWIDNKNWYVSSSLLDTGYVYGSGTYTANATVIDKDGNSTVAPGPFISYGVRSYLYAPASPVYVDGVYLFGCTRATKGNVNDATFQPLMNGAELTMSIYDQDTDELLETLTATTGDWTGWSTSTTANIGTYRRGALKFSKKVDGEEVPIIIDKKTMIEITGFESDDVDLGIFGVLSHESILDDGYVNFGYNLFYDPSGEYEVLPIYMGFMANNIPIMLNGIMDKVYATEGTNDLYVSTNGSTCSNKEGENFGGVIVRTALPWVDETTGEANYTASEVLPSWITDIRYKAYGDEENEYIVYFIAEANTDVEQRSATIYLQGKGFTDPTPITLTQYGRDDPDGISDVAAPLTQKDGAIYNLAGQKVSQTTKGVLVKDGKKFLNK